MKLTEIVQGLDQKFNIKNIPPDMPFSKLAPELYKKAGIDIGKYFTENFLNSFHGLMTRNGEEISKVYLMVFLSEEILDKIFVKDEKNILIFSHHPLEMETSNRGFLPLAERYLEEMQHRNVSIYVLHTPLDINEEISTSGSIANILGLENKIRFARNSAGFSGVAGELKQQAPFEQFLAETAKMFGIIHPSFVKNRDNVRKIGIIAGGGSNPKLILEVVELGCDTYLTGDYVNRINNEYGRQEKKEFNKILPLLDINLIACSHYGTEKIVIVNEIQNYFTRELKLSCDFIEQDNPWK